MIKLVFAVACLVVFTTQSVRGYCDTCSDCCYPADCSEIFESGQTLSGVYKIQPWAYSESFHVYCDMDTVGGGWTVIQRRLDGSVTFFRNWADYRDGFGNVNSEYWLGNEKLFHLTAQGSYVLRVDLEDFDGEKRHAIYDHFRIGDAGTKYELFLGDYSGTAGDSFGSHANQPFTTTDADNDDWVNNCATEYKGGWWYTACHSSNLNGLYLGGPHTSYADGIEWSAWRGQNYSYKVAAMKIRRL